MDADIPWTPKDYDMQLMVRRCSSPLGLIANSSTIICCRDLTSIVVVNWFKVLWIGKLRRGPREREPPLPQIMTCTLPHWGDARANSPSEECNGGAGPKPSAFLITDRPRPGKYVLMSLSAFILYPTVSVAFLCGTNLFILFSHYNHFHSSWHPLIHEAYTHSIYPTIGSLWVCMYVSIYLTSPDNYLAPSLPGPWFLSKCI